MPLPTPGNTELEHVRSNSSQIKAPNFDAVKHVRKAVIVGNRVGNKENSVDIVKVELSDEEICAVIIKSLVQPFGKSSAVIQYIRWTGQFNYNPIGMIILLPRILPLFMVQRRYGAQVCKMPIVVKVDDSLKKKKPLFLYIRYVIDCTLK